MKMGIVQGRLLPPVNGFIQKFPEENWKEEFEILPALGLTHIEWLVTKERFLTNPLFTEKISGLPITAFGLDIMNNSEIVNGEFFRKHMFPLAEAVLNQGYDKLSLPLLEHSTLRDKVTFTKVRAFIHDLLHRYQNLKISVEVDLSHPEHVLPLIDHERMFLTHDIGNYTATSWNSQGGSCWYAHQNFLEAIYYAGKLDCIHLKDKNYGGENVPPGKGNSPFREIFKWLSTRDLSDVLFTLQTAREKPGEEIATIENYMKYFEDYEK